MARKKGSKDYPVEVKREAIRLVFEEGWTQAEITKQLAIQDPKRVKNWIWRYRKVGEAMFTAVRRGRPPRQEDQAAYIARLEMENDLLKKIPHRIAQGLARAARYRCIQAERGRYDINAMCRFFGLSRAAFYAWQKRQGQEDPDQRRLDLVLRAYQASRRTYGYRRIQLWLQGHEGVRINHKAVLRLMNKLGIRSVARRPRPYRYWQQSDNQHRYPNHLARNFHAPRPNRKWVTDITYIRTQQAWSYLVVIKDLYDGFIVGHRFSSRNDVSLVR